jgi:serine protease Do
LADERIGIRVEELDVNSARGIGFSEPGGVVITDVQRGSAADQRGIVPGLRVVQVNGLDVSDPEDVRKSLDAVRAGQVIGFVLEAPQGQRRIVNVRMPAN